MKGRINKLHRTYKIFEDLVSSSKSKAGDILRHYNQWRKGTNSAYKNMTDDEIDCSIHNYVTTKSPEYEDLRLDDCLKCLSITYDQGMVASLAIDGIELKDTVFGFYLSKGGYEELKRMANDYESLFSLFYNEAVKIVTVEESDIKRAYYSFLHLNCNDYFWIKKINFLTTKCIDNYCFLKAYNNYAIDLIRSWLIYWFNMEDSVPEGCLTLKETAEYLGVEEQILGEWLKDKPNMYVKNGFLVYPQKEDIDKLKDIISESTDLRLLVDKIRCDYLKLSLKQSFEATVNSLKDTKLVYSGANYVGLEKTSWYYAKRNEEDVTKHITQCFMHLPLYSLSMLTKITGMKLNQLIKMAEQRIITATRHNEQLRVAKEEILRIETITQRFIGLEMIVKSIVLDKETNFDIAFTKNHQALIDFIEGNSWWGISHYESQIYPFIKTTSKYLINKQDSEQLKRHIKLWIIGYGRSNEEKSLIMLDYYSKKIPKTCSLLHKYFAFVNKTGTNLKDQAVKNLLDFILPLLTCELTDMNEEDIETGILSYLDELALVSRNVFAQFLYESKLITYKITFMDSGISREEQAYSLKDFAVMLYATLNTEAWKTLGLINKSINNKRCSDLWLFVALHFFAAWRKTDFIKLPCPQLPYSAEETLFKISKGEYPREDAIRVANYFRILVDSYNQAPNKTSAHTYIPNLVFLLPSSCEYEFGIILSIAAAHYKIDNTADNFINIVCDTRTIDRFFGIEFLSACEYRDFKTRRANKAILQADNIVGNDGSYHGPKAYMLTSLIRSHKGGFSELSNTTAIYLHDAGLINQDPQFILYQMFERGVCSYVIEILLRKVFGDEYRRLPMTVQTKIINEVGLPAFSIHSLVKAAQVAEDNAESIVNEILNSSNSKTSAKEMLEAIRACVAVGKSPNSQCCLIAAGLGCKEKQRKICTGCRYEIKTKLLLSFYLNEKDRILNELKKETIKTNNLELQRRLYALKYVIIPSIAEICTIISQNTSLIEIEEYKKLRKESNVVSIGTS